MTSLWAPLSILALAFLPYLLVVELHTCAHLWLQPIMKGLGLLMAACFVLLVLARGVFPKEFALRSLRHKAMELIEEVGKVATRRRAALGDKNHEALLVGSVSLRRLLLARDEGPIRAALESLTETFKPHRQALGRFLLFDGAAGFVKALAVALLIRAVVLEPFKIPSGSMIPTLEIGDQIFVNKFLYGVRVPWLNLIVPFQLIRAPQRGDVIVFNNPVETEKDYVKRVVGVPGDVVELRRKVVYLNGVEQPTQVVNEAYLFADEHAGRWYVKESALVREDLGFGPHFTMRDRGSPFGEQGPYTVPEGHVFVLGDNRDGSMDSRYGLGDFDRGVQYVPYGSIKGKAMVIWFAWGYGGLGSSLFDGVGLRTERLFQPVPLCAQDEPPKPADESHVSRGNSDDA